jgi:hypothetical protein
MTRKTRGVPGSRKSNAIPRAKRAANPSLAAKNQPPSEPLVGAIADQRVAQAATVLALDIDAVSAAGATPSRDRRPRKGDASAPSPDRAPGQPPAD